MSWWYQPEEKEDDLNPADDGESSEKSHGSTNQTQLSLKLDFLVSLDLVESCRVKEDLHQLKLNRKWELFSWDLIFPK